MLNIRMKRTLILNESAQDVRGVLWAPVAHLAPLLMRAARAPYT